MTTTKTIAIAAVAVALITSIPAVMLWQRNLALQQEVSDLHAAARKRPLQAAPTASLAPSVSQGWGEIKAPVAPETPAADRNEAAAHG